MKQITTNEARKINGGNYHCTVCGYTGWGNNEVQTHAWLNHGSPKWVHFHWSGPTNGYYKCSKVKYYGQTNRKM